MLRSLGTKANKRSWLDALKALLSLPTTKTSEDMKDKVRLEASGVCYRGNVLTIKIC